MLVYDLFSSKYNNKKCCYPCCTTLIFLQGVCCRYFPLVGVFHNKLTKCNKINTILCNILLSHGHMFTPSSSVDRMVGGILTYSSTLSSTSEFYALVYTGLGIQKIARCQHHVSVTSSLIRVMIVHSYPPIW